MPRLSFVKSPDVCISSSAGHISALTEGTLVPCRGTFLNIVISIFKTYNIQWKK